MNNIVNTGEYFDLMFVNNTNYSKFVNLNALENITDLVQSETPDLYGFIPGSFGTVLKFIIMYMQFLLIKILP